MPYGVDGGMTKPEFIVSHLRTIQTDPPTYLVEVNGRDIRLASDEFISHLKFRRRLEELHALVIEPMKQDQWDDIRRKLYETQEIIEAPEDASEDGATMAAAMDFFTRYKNNTRGEEGLLMGSPTEYRDKYMAFKSTDLFNFLRNHKRIKISEHHLYSLLHAHGAFSPSPIKIHGKSVRVWLLPMDKLNIQTEDYAPHEFPKVAEEI